MSRWRLLYLFLLPVAAWLAMAGAVGLYRFFHDGWASALIPGAGFVVGAVFLAQFAVRRAAVRSKDAG